MRITALITGLVLLAVTPANAVFIGFDTEPNNAPDATADPLISDDGDFNVPLCALSADVGIATLGAGPVGDMDFYSVFIPAGCILTAITTPLSPFGPAPDTLLFVFDPLPLGGNDDAGADINSAGPVRGSALRILSLVTKTYWLGVTGFPDFGYTGSHGETGSYLLTVSITPEPATIGLLAGGLLLALRRRVR